MAVHEKSGASRMAQPCLQYHAKGLSSAMLHPPSLVHIRLRLMFPAAGLPFRAFGSAIP